MKTERESFVPHWRDISEHFLPRQSRFLTTDRNRGHKKNDKIINEAGIIALRVLANGMLSGMSNPARPWIVLKTPDPALNKYKPVKEWLTQFRDRMLEIFIRSNLYTIFPLIYKDLGGYGTMCYLLLEDEESFIRGYHYPVGSFYLANNDRGKVDTVYREFEMTPRQLVAKFGFENCSKTVQSLASNAADKETWVCVTHAIETNEDYEPRSSMLSRNKRYKSCYFETGTNEDKFLSEKGYDSFPALAGRWDVIGEDIYGSSPAMDVLGTVRQLQIREKRKSQLIDKGVNPPMGAPTSMKNKRSSVLPGDVTYYAQTAQGQKFEPLYLPAPAYYQWVLEDIQACTNRINSGMYKDLFLMMQDDFRSNITAREIAERHEEKLLQLGPVLLRQSDEHFDPLVERVSAMMFEHNIAPPIPPELEGRPLVVEYVSILAQAMKMVGVTNIERMTGYIATIGQGKPAAMDMIDEDAAIMEYADMIGAPPTMIRDKREVEQIRVNRAKQQASQQMAGMMQPAADTAKTLSETDTRGQNALTDITQALGGAQ